ncbi:MAG: iron ABC transporter permease [Candidatus Methanomethylophilaceae archaeon]|nr:iron ABC transporter permease [Candidatus Methanomethylophilaceae archaeon]
MTSKGMADIEASVDRWMSRRESMNADERMSEYSRYIGRKVLFIMVCIAAAVLAAGYDLTIGPYDISIWKTYEVIWNHICGLPVAYSDELVIWTMRLPRIVTGIIAGFGLAIAGVVMQTILRNPLADPYTTGVSSGASFGASLAIGFGLSLAGAGSLGIVLNAFIFSLIPMAVIVFVSKMRGASPATMIMAGIAVMYIFNAMTTMIKLWVDADTLANIFAWSVGTLDVKGWDHILTMFLFTAAAGVLLMLMSRRLNVLSTGDESARSIGINANRLRLVSLFIVSMLTAGIVSFTGLIGFVGLVCPHIARIIVGSDVKYLLPASGFFGSALLIAADIVGRSVFEGSALQVGVVTAFIGGPMFLWLIVRQKKETW